MTRVVLFLIVLALWAPTPASAQHSELDDLAARVAKHIQKKNKKRVYVVPFRGRNGTLSALGDELTRSFRESLGRAAPTIEVMDESALVPLAKRFGLAPYWAKSPGFAENAALAGAELIVTGILESRKNTSRLTTKLRLPYDSTFAEESADLATLLPGSMEEKPVIDEESGAYIATLGGVTYPECGQCPIPTYTDPARDKKVSGRILFVATVTAEGRVTDIRILQPLEPSLDKRATETLSSWRLKPARGPDGKAVAVRLLVEMTFQLY